jgi:hypothetical protein
MHKNLMMMVSLLTLFSVSAHGQIDQKEEARYKSYVASLSQSDQAIEFSKRSASALWYCGSDTVKAIREAVEQNKQPVLDKNKSPECITQSQYFSIVEKVTVETFRKSLASNGIGELNKTYSHFEIQYPKAINSSQISRGGNGFCMQEADELYNHWSTAPTWPPLGAYSKEMTNTKCEIERVEGSNAGSLFCSSGWIGGGVFDFDTREIFLQTSDYAILTPEEKKEFSKPLPKVGDLDAQVKLLDRRLNAGYHFIYTLSLKENGTVGTLELRGYTGAVWHDGVYKKRLPGWYLKPECAIRSNIEMTVTPIQAGKFPPTNNYGFGNN